MAALREDYPWIALNMVPGLGFVRVKNLVAHFGSPEKILCSSPEELMKVQGIGKEFASRISDFKAEQEVRKELSLAEKHGVSLITIDDDNYPPRLREIFDPPLVLYVHGDISSADEASVAVVGTRYPSFYGKMVAEDLGRKLASRDVTVVSGLARGIDTAAHKGALSEPGRTIAVLGSGVDVCYPPENAGMMARIARSGAVVSEYPMGTTPEKGNFPRRNRIISGLSLGVVVVEAAQKSGSLITACLALEQGREVFAVPGKVDSPKSIGTNGLIKEGAKLVNGIDDVLEELQPALKCAGSGDRFPVAYKSLTTDEISVLENLAYEAVSAGALGAKAGMHSSKMDAILDSLVSKGFLRRIPGGLFARTKESEHGKK